MQLKVEYVPEAERVDALGILFHEFPPEERQTRIAATLEAVSRGQLSLEGLQQVCCRGERLGVVLTMAQPDGVTLVWPPVIADGTGESFQGVFQAAMSAVCSQLDTDGSRLGQVLINSEELELAAQLRHAGFLLESRLFFLARRLDDSLPDLEAYSWESVSYSATTHHRFVNLLAATYIGSLDCPHLHGIRTAEEALECHKLSGCFHEELWQIFTTVDGQGRSEDVAVCLLNDHPEQDAVELTYFGVAPSQRGKGWGRRILGESLCRARRLGRESMFLAVDAVNHHANIIYGELGFVELARRHVLFRPCAGLARQPSTGS